MQRKLELDHSPALSAPLRFFISAPLFAIVAAGVLLWAGPDAFASRWSPYALALAHLCALGMLATTMIGAMIQIMSVAAGIRIASPVASATAIHACLTLGTLLLAAAFACAAPALFAPAALMLSAAFLWFALACGIGFARHWRRMPAGAASVLRTVRLALTALAATIALGVSLGLALGWRLPFFSIARVDLHATWGLAGWVGLLTIGISYQLIPMFQVTEPYPRIITRCLGPCVFALLGAASIVALGFAGRVGFAADAIRIALYAAYAAFAALTFRLLWSRKRTDADTTTLFWRTATASVGCGGLLWIAHAGIGGRDVAVTTGVLLMMGGAWSAINGMLYKIIPFLLWYHAQKSSANAIPALPKVKDMLPDRIARRQFFVHVVALLLLVAASVTPGAFARPAAVALGVSTGWLAVNMLGALRRYAQVRRRIASILHLRA
ncbi:hypothetical protein WS70_05905 [Burkholderia mayonis]|uniref:Uncharacterized protein n=1 Tax=Burkholderia mayonis TaxID=1385591 RepID=A0A1B4FCV2_9BURK|nr:hypothetical protein [Burkholderia mayonis]AOJ01422.1 hypothetical protein WS70_05905 [Burkholderia mayonis]KVE49091.1 hypothetical protein WS70_20920 [Burkholderia mayonis]